MQFAAIVFLLFGFCQATAFTADQSRFQQQTLASHNQLRARHCAPALALDDGLSQTAQAFAELLASKNQFQHSGNGYGENLYMKGSSAPLTNLNGSVATQAWYDEIKDYDFNNPGFSMKVGHFTQVVWKGSQKLGVGIAFANNGNKAIVVANYSPPGNYMGQFDKQVSSAQC